jgi:uncharacterized protein YecT (DUF1311 family)
MFVLLLALSAAQTADECKTAMDQPTRAVCADDEFARVDDALNAQWKKTLAVVRQHDRTSKLKREPEFRAAQRAWVTFRDSHCDSMFAAHYEANPEYIESVHCRVQLTAERTKQLQEIAEWVPSSAN